MRRFRVVAIWAGLLFLFVYSAGAAEVRQPIAFGFYYTFSEAEIIQYFGNREKFSENLSRYLLDIGVRSNANPVVGFLKEVPFAPIPRHEITSSISVIEPDSFFSALREQKSVGQDLESADFIFVLTSDYIILDFVATEQVNNEEDIFGYDLVGGKAESIGGRIALLEYNEDDKYFTNLIFHEWGHLLGLYHPEEELCKLRKLVMCPSGQRTEIEDELKRLIREFTSISKREE